MAYYIVCTAFRSISFMGPFDTYRAAADHAKDPKFNPQDDPSWQIVRITTLPEVISPGPMPIDPHTTYEDPAP